MGYTAHEWGDGDQVTSTLLNNIENGVTAVGYTPTTWASGDTVTAEKLNKLEHGVANANQLEDLINGTITEFTITSDMQDGDHAINIGTFARFSFCNCEDLETINGLELVTRVNSNAFSGCTKLTEIDAPNATQIGEVSCMSSAIAGSGIEKISLGKATAIGSNTLCGGDELKYVYLPKAVTIGGSIQGDQKLQHVYIGADCTTINGGCFSGSGGSGTGVGLVIDCGFAEGAVSGAPWGATNATVNYGVADPGSIDAMIEVE